MTYCADHYHPATGPEWAEGRQWIRCHKKATTEFRLVVVRTSGSTSRYKKRTYEKAAEDMAPYRVHIDADGPYFADVWIESRVVTPWAVDEGLPESGTRQAT